MTPKLPKLVFGKGNAKLGSEIYTFSLPAGYSCPGAKLCQSRADRHTGKIADGKDTLFRCFAASQEALYPAVRKSRWANFETLKKLDTQEMINLITISLPKKARIVRIHVSGDFFSAQYFNAWYAVAEMHPHILFYAYTKSVHLIPEIWPQNFRLTFSEGGKYDYLIEGRKSARVVFDPIEAEALGLEVDHDDSHAYDSDSSFALLIHGTQPKGSMASRAKSKLKKK